MLLRAFLLFACFLLPNAAFSASPDAEFNAGDPDIAELRTLIYAHDIDGTEAFIDAAQGRYLAGELHADDIRRIFMAFTTTHPTMIAFTRDWLAERPSSQYALVARGWALDTAGWQIRGTDAAAYTHPDALKLFRATQAEAGTHARAAYAMGPDFIPGSDLVIALGNAGDRLAAFQALDHVMESRPNFGTLYRALALTRQGWGGSLRIAENMCKYYGPRMTWIDDFDPVSVCRIAAIDGYHRDAMDTIRDEIMNSTAPRFATFRFRLGMGSNMTEEFARTFHDYVLTHEDYDNVSVTRRYDSHAPFKFDMPFLQEIVGLRARKSALAALEHDPYDPDIISTLFEPVYHLEMPEGQVRPTVTKIAEPTDEEAADYAYRRLIANPFDASNWFSYAVNTMDSGPENVFRADIYFENAIAYSPRPSQRGRMILGYLTAKFEQARMQVANLEKPASPEWREWAENVDIEAQIQCPVVRAARVLMQLCTAKGENPSCRSASIELKPHLKLVEKLHTEGKCGDIFAATPEELAYTPIEVPGIKPIY